MEKSMSRNINTLWQSIQKLIRYLSPDQSGEPTNQPADSAVPRAMSLAWLKINKIKTAPRGLHKI